MPDARSLASGDCVVGLIGLGNIGAAVADVLLQDGLEVWGYDVDSRRWPARRPRACRRPARRAKWRRRRR